VASLHAQKTQLPQRGVSIHSQKTQAPQSLPVEVKSVPPPPSPEPAGPTATLPPVTKRPYTPPQKGMFGSFSRAIDFFQQMLALGKAEPALRRPILTNVMMATPVMIAVSALLLVLRSGSALYLVMSIGTALLYFIDYIANAATASLMYDYVTTGKIDVANAKARVKKSRSGILTFAAISALLDIAATYARERSDILSKILLRVLYSIWTTATYWIMPAMVIEGVSFQTAFSRSKKLMDQDPTGVGAGVVALSLISYLCGAIIFPAAFFLSRVGAHIHPVVGVLLYFATVNLYWALSGWLKIAYSTCFYMWAKECETAGKPDPALAPLPLRHALDAG
jgi:hypothetical protein